MPISPMELHFYNNETNEVEKTFTRTFVPWKMLKEAIKLQEKLGDIDLEKLREDEVDEIMAFMVAFYGGQFSLEEASEKADLMEVVAILTTIMTAANGGLPKNPLAAKK